MFVSTPLLRRALPLLGALSIAAPGLSLAAEVRHQGEISYVCGGVGETEMQDLQAMAPKFNLGFWMVEGPRGEYLADIPVRILQKGKTVAEFTAEGPLCYVSAPKGAYTIRGRYKDEDRSVSVHTGNKNAYLRW